MESNNTRSDILIARIAAKTGFKSKVEAKCIDCIYDEKDKGTWRQQVQACKCTSCPLYDVRPTVSSVKKPVKVKGVVSDS